MRALVLASCVLVGSSCLPAAPDLDGDPAQPDVGVAKDTWSEEDLESWSGPGTQGESSADTGVPDPDGSSGPDDTAPELDPGLSRLRITELLVDPPGKDGTLDAPEFIELLNPAAQPVALDGLSLEARSWPTLTAADLGLEALALDPGQRLVVLRYAGDVTPPPDLPLVGTDAIVAALTTSAGLRNDDGGALIHGAHGEPADLLVYGASQPAPYDDADAWSGSAASTPPAGASLCRPNESVDHDQADDWQACTPSPGAAPALDDPEPDVPDTGHIVIVEIFSNPPGPSSDEKTLEFVELYNADDHAVDLSAFTIADAVDDQAPGTDPVEFQAGDGGCSPKTCLAPGHRALVVGNAYAGESADALVLHVDDSTLANGGLGLLEPVLLRDGDGALVSSYRVWVDPAADPNPTGTELALQRASPDAADEAQSWAFGPSTPGE